MRKGTKKTQAVAPATAQEKKPTNLEKAMSEHLEADRALNISKEKARNAKLLLAAAALQDDFSECADRVSAHAVVQAALDVCHGRLLEIWDKACSLFAGCSYSLPDNDFDLSSLAYIVGRAPSVPNGLLTLLKDYWVSADSAKRAKQGYVSILKKVLIPNKALSPEQIPLLPPGEAIGYAVSIADKILEKQNKQSIVDSILAGGGPSEDAAAFAECFFGKVNLDLCKLADLAAGDVKSLVRIAGFDKTWNTVRYIVNKAIEDEKSSMQYLCELHKAFPRTLPRGVLRHAIRERMDAVDATIDYMLGEGHPPVMLRPMGIPMGMPMFYWGPPRRG